MNTRSYLTAILIAGMFLIFSAQLAIAEYVYENEFDSDEDPPLTINEESDGVVQIPVTCYNNLRTPPEGNCIDVNAPDNEMAIANVKTEDIVYDSTDSYLIGSVYWRCIGDSQFNISIVSNGHINITVENRNNELRLLAATGDSIADVTNITSDEWYVLDAHNDPEEEGFRLWVNDNPMVNPDPIPGKDIYLFLWRNGDFNDYLEFGVKSSDSYGHIQIDYLFVDDDP